MGESYFLLIVLCPKSSSLCLWSNHILGFIDQYLSKVHLFLTIVNFFSSFILRLNLVGDPFRYEIFVFVNTHCFPLGVSFVLFVFVLFMKP